MSNSTNGSAPKDSTGQLSFGSLLESVRAKCNPAAPEGTQEEDDAGLEYVDEEVTAGQATNLAVVGEEEITEYEYGESQDTDIAPTGESAALDIGMDVDFQGEDLDASQEPGGLMESSARRLTRSLTSKGPEDLEQTTKKKGPEDLEQMTRKKGSPAKGTAKNLGKAPAPKAAKAAKAAGTGSKATTGRGGGAPTSVLLATPLVTATAAPTAGDSVTEEVPTTKKERKPAGRPPKGPHVCPTQALADEVAKLTEANKAHDTYTRALARSLAKERQRVGEQQQRIDAQQRKLDDQQRRIEEHLRKAEVQQGKLTEVLRKVAEQEVKTEGLRHRMKTAETQVATTMRDLNDIHPILANVNDFIGSTQTQLEGFEGDLARALAVGIQVNDVDERLRRVERSDDGGYDGLGKRQRGDLGSSTTGAPSHSGFGFQAPRQTAAPVTQRPAPPVSTWTQRPIAAMTAITPAPPPTRPRLATLRVGPLDARGKPFDVLKSYVLAIPNGEHMMSSVGRVRIDPQSSEHITAMINPPEQAELFLAAWNSFDFPRSAVRPFATLSYQGN